MLPPAGRVPSPPSQLKEHQVGRKAATEVTKDGEGLEPALQGSFPTTVTGASLSAVGKDEVFSFSHVAWAQWMTGPRPSTVLAAA